MNGFQFMFTYEILGISLKMFTAVLLLTADCHLWVTMFCIFLKGIAQKKSAASGSKQNQGPADHHRDESKTMTHNGLPGQDDIQ